MSKQNNLSLYLCLGLMGLAQHAAVGDVDSASEEGLTFETKHLQFEAAQGDDKIEGIFKFTNTSDQTVNILDVKSSCGCTVPNLEKKVYKPGESGEIKAVFTIGSRVGNQKKHIGLMTDASDEMISLLLETDIKEPVKIRPRFLLWSSDTEAKEVTLTIDSEKAYKIHSINVNQGFTYETIVEKPGELYKILITPPVDATSIRGLMNIEVKNVTQDKVLPRVAVHLRVRLPIKPKQSKEDEVKRHFTTLETSLNLYNIHMSGFPTTADGLDALVQAPPHAADRWRGPYLAQEQLLIDPWGSPYQYAYPATESSKPYDVWSMGPDKQTGGDDDIWNW